MEHVALFVQSHCPVLNDPFNNTIRRLMLLFGIIWGMNLAIHDVRSNLIVLRCCGMSIAFYLKQK